MNALIRPNQLTPATGPAPLDRQPLTSSAHVVHHAWSCGERIPCPFGSPACERFEPYRPGEAIRTPYGDVLLLCHGCGQSRTEARKQVAS